MVNNRRRDATYSPLLPLRDNVHSSNPIGCSSAPCKKAIPIMILRRFETNPDPIPFKEYFDVKVAVFTGANQESFVTDVDVLVDTMPEHEHGMNISPIHSIDENGYTKQWIEWFMTGEWQLEFYVTPQDGGNTETAFFQLSVATMTMLFLLTILGCEPTHESSFTEMEQFVIDMQRPSTVPDETNQWDGTRSHQLAKHFSSNSPHPMRLHVPLVMYQTLDFLTFVQSFGADVTLRHSPSSLTFPHTWFRWTEVATPSGVMLHWSFRITK